MILYQSGLLCIKKENYLYLYAFPNVLDAKNEFLTYFDRKTVYILFHFKILYDIIHCVTLEISRACHLPWCHTMSDIKMFRINLWSHGAQYGATGENVTPWYTNIVAVK